MEASRRRPGLIRSALQPEETAGLTRSGDLSRMLPAEAHLLAAGWPRAASDGGAHALHAVEPSRGHVGACLGGVSVNAGQGEVGSTNEWPIFLLHALSRGTCACDGCNELKMCTCAGWLMPCHEVDV